MLYGEVRLTCRLTAVPGHVKG